MISNKSKIRIKHEKELNSLRNKMGRNTIWFDALNKTQQYDLLFRWKSEKNNNKLIYLIKLSIKSKSVAVGIKFFPRPSIL